MSSTKHIQLHAKSKLTFTVASTIVIVDYVRNTKSYFKSMEAYKDQQKKQDI